MKKIVFASITALIFSCSIGVASAYSYNNEHAANKASQPKECSCTDCSCKECSCTDCAHGDCAKSCCTKSASCCAKHVAK